MNTIKTTLLRSLCAVALGASLAVTFAAPTSAQAYYPGPYHYDRTYHGTIYGVIVSSVPYFLNLRVADGRVWPVNLHNGTVINPRGITLRAGMAVTIHGHRERNGGFRADDINFHGWAGGRRY